MVNGYWWFYQKMTDSVITEKSAVEVYNISQIKKRFSKEKQFRCTLKYKSMENKLKSFYVSTMNL